MSAILFNHWRMAILGARYTEEVLVVESVRFGKMTRRGSARVPIVEGTVNGNPETVSLLMFDVEAETLAALERDLPTGSHLSILFDSTAPRFFTQGKTLRAIPPSTNLQYAWVKATGLTIIPGIFLLAGGIGQWICLKRRR